MISVGLFLVVIALLMAGLLSNSAVYTAGMMDGYKIGASDGINYTKTRLFEQNYRPEEISSESYDFYKTHMKGRFHSEMWEIEPSYPTDKEIYEDLMKGISAGLFILGMVMTVWGCIQDVVMGRRS